MRLRSSLATLAGLALLLTPAFCAQRSDPPNDKTFVAPRPSHEKIIAPGDTDGKVARLTALLLQRQHYSQKGLNSEISSKFLDKYLNAMDPMRLYFIKSDIESFEMFRNTLHTALKTADVSPGFAMFNRYLDRVEQQYAYLTELLTQKDEWEFSSDDRYIANRKDLTRPADLAEAKRMWRDRFRFEYLAEKLNLVSEQEVEKLVREKWEQKKEGELGSALKDKVGKEKSTELLKALDSRSTGASNDRILQEMLATYRRLQHEEVVKTIHRRYSRVLRAYRDYDSDDVMEYYLTALAAVYDPHSDFMGRAELDNFSISMNLSLFGIGAVLQSEDGFCKIKELMPAGPAAKSGKLKPNDKIVAVAQGPGDFVDVVDMKLTKVVEQIRGPKGTHVRLTINPADAPDPSVRKEIELVRDEIKLEDQEAKARILEFPDAEGKTQKLGFIDLPSFYASFAVGSQKRDESDNKSTTTDVARLLKRLIKENVSGVILDLRHNGGGSLEEAINLTGLFIKKGPVVQVRNADDTVEVDEDVDPRVAYDGPLMVLTSRFSASASEILAGALQDYGRALIVGDTSTHGKGTVQQVIQLNRLLGTSTNLGAVKLTIRKFYRASGDSTQLKGVIPDVVLPSVNDALEVGEKELEHALPFDTIRPASYDKLDRIAPVLAQVRLLSEKRVGSDRDFDYVKREMTRIKKLREDKSYSMNEVKRRQEKEDNKTRLEARKKELLARGEPPGKIIEFKLKDAEAPTLPPPLQKTNKVASVSKHGGRIGEERTGETKDSKDKDGAVAGGDAKAGEGATDGDDLGPLPDESVQEVDATLEEAKRILLDFVRLTRKEPGVAVAK
ncbi:MAG: carboxy terminal-processing peptidase [Verrucomicrobia bacterium]|nr:carboxy terminal-processing peptidase [Verrucomicrobiota bacterium]MBI3870053.1 carboxy terminal-processing peptidase [Verrucomicrobiota bacterium]